MHPPSALSDVESDTEKGSADEVGCYDASIESSDQAVSDREPASVAVPQEKSVDEGGDRSTLCVDGVQPGGPVDSKWSNVDLEVPQAQTGNLSDNADTCSLSSVATYTLAMEDSYGLDGHPLWAWVSGGGCSVDSHSQLNWFHSTTGTSCRQTRLKPFYLFLL